MTMATPPGVSATRKPDYSAKPYRALPGIVADGFLRYGAAAPTIAASIARIVPTTYELIN